MILPIPSCCSFSRSIVDVNRFSRQQYTIKLDTQNKISYYICIDHKKGEFNANDDFEQISGGNPKTGKGTSKVEAKTETDGNRKR